MRSEEPRTIDARGRPLVFHLRRSGRRTLGISVEPDRRVLVTAPADATEERITTALRRRAGWIRHQQRVFEALPPPPSPRQWVAGETHRYLGRQYRLKLVKASIHSVRLAGGYFAVALADTSDRVCIQRLMDRWYRQHAETLLEDRVARIISSTTWLEMEPPPITVRVMRKRWGSTTRSGRIYFNLDVVKLPLGCIDYVAVHELAHLRIPHHGPAFWRMLDRCMPDWRAWRERLMRLEA
jgi:predicted metal-dependent hydrolase